MRSAPPRGQHSARPELAGLNKFHAAHGDDAVNFVAGSADGPWVSADSSRIP